MSSSRLILASGSAARRQMLDRAGIEFEIVPASIDEDRVRDSVIATATHAGIALALAEAKALSVATDLTGAVVIGSDQILSTGEGILSKPGSRQGARETLRVLRGRTHWLHSAAALVADGRVIWRGVDTAALSMRALSDTDIERYLDAAGDGIFGCVGAYKIEGEGIRLFDRISGDYFTVMGMPLLPLLRALRRLERVAA
jgi:septum formation protein